MYKQLDLAGKVAVVVGGSSGIGKVLALGLAKGGADVVSSARRKDLVDELAGEIEALGRRSLRVTCDVADRSSLERLLKACLDAFGKVDILVNAAGVTKRAPTLDYKEEDWNRILETNLTGALRACQVFGRHMIERRYGRIINIASMGSFLALFEVAAYSASKSGLASLASRPRAARASSGRRRSMAPSSSSTPSWRSRRLRADILSRRAAGRASGWCWRTSRSSGGYGTRQ